MIKVYKIGFIVCAVLSLIFGGILISQQYDHEEVINKLKSEIEDKKQEITKLKLDINELEETKVKIQNEKQRISAVKELLTNRLAGEQEKLKVYIAKVNEAEQIVESKKLKINQLEAKIKLARQDMKTKQDELGQLASQVKHEKDGISKLIDQHNKDLAAIDNI